MDPAYSDVDSEDDAGAAAAEAGGPAATARRLLAEPFFDVLQGPDALGDGGAHLQGALAEAAALERTGRMERGALAKQGVGGQAPRGDVSGRTDRCMWLHASGAHETCAHLRALDDAMERFARTLGPALGSALTLTRRTDAQLACYHPGASYGKHVDNPDGDGQPDGDGRRVALVYYLNAPAWDAAADGGALRVYGSGGARWDVAPSGGTLVVFRADVVAHEVLPPVARARFALTTWWCGALNAGG